MKRTLPALAILILSLASADVALADRVELEDHLGQAMGQLNRQDVGALREYANCRQSLAAAKKLFRRGDKLRAQAFEHHPQAVKDGDTYAITVADLPWMCDEIDRMVAHATLFESLTMAQSYQRTLATKPAPDERAHLSEGDESLAQATRCAAAVAAEAAHGATAIEWKGASIPIADATGLCEAIRAWGDYQNASGEANFEKVAPTYRALGIDGDRLRLFVANETVYFRGKRCEKLEDPKALAKARYAYLWLVNADDTHTIRKYTFTGNRYKMVEKTFTFERQAYAFCK
ncbi:MAG: hypothetical protein IPL61_24020 [Myxococcales bacterium]|nr:hypothetical protein [Myxococcales bacterium]